MNILDLLISQIKKNKDIEIGLSKREYKKVEHLIDKGFYKGYKINKI